jgi:uncharacterized protein YkwD
MRLKLFSWLAAGAVVLAVGAATISALHARVGSSALAASNLPLISTGSGPSIAPTLSSPDALSAPGSATKSRPHAPSASVAPRPSIVIGSYQQQLINQDRASAGLRPLTWSSCLASVAAANAARLSRQGWTPPYHTNGPTLDLGCHLGYQAGENVGYWSGGINDSQLNSMFMASPEHHANIMGSYHYVATAWAVAANGYAYIAVEFA